MSEIMNRIKLNKSICLIFSAVLLLVISSPLYAATISWKHSSGEVDGYRVYYSTSSSSLGSHVDVGYVDKYSMDPLPLKENVKYYLCVAAYNTAGVGKPCSPIAFIPGDATPPAPPKGLIASVSQSTGGSSSSNGSTEVAVWWTAVSTRNSAVPIKIYDGGSLLATKTVNQKTNGGKWNVLGKYTFNNSPKVVVMVQNGDAGSSCADAVRLKSADGKSVIIDNGKSGTTSSGTWKTSSGAKYYGTKSVYSRSGSYTFKGSIP